MKDCQQSLPQGFEALQPFVKKWAVHGAAERQKARLESAESERMAFYDATVGVFQEALLLLDQKLPAQFSEQETTLMNLLLSFAHVALAVEIQKGDEARHGQLRRHMNITRASADI